MKQKVIKVGDSAAVVIPKKFLEELRLKVGDEVRFEIDEEGNKVLIKPDVSVDKELVKWIDDFIEKHRAVLEKLAK